MAADKSVGRAEAMRQSMLALIDKGAPYEAQPAYWAPFVVVGEGRLGYNDVRNRLTKRTKAASNPRGLLRVRSGP